MKVKLSSLTLLGESAGSVVVEIDMPGADEPVRCKPAPFKKDGSKAMLVFEQTYDCTADSPITLALVEALATNEPADSEIHFVVFGFVEKDGSGEERAIGLARLSLEGLLEAGKDAASVPLAIKGDNGNGSKVGELIVSVAAVQTMKEIKRASMGEQPASAEGAALPNSSRRSDASAASGASAAPGKPSSATVRI